LDVPKLALDNYVIKGKKVMASEDKKQGTRDIDSLKFIIPTTEELSKALKVATLLARPSIADWSNQQANEWLQAAIRAMCNDLHPSGH
jgi:hypothetical protein